MEYLNFFEERMVRDTGAKLALTVTGDRHHYARYEPEGEGSDAAPTRLTAGGGGAYLSGTHTLPEQLKLGRCRARRARTTSSSPWSTTSARRSTRARPTRGG